ncbi:MAG: hypothetical protein AABZ31_00660 [Bdellovibrionota bacterium]
MERNFLGILRAQRCANERGFSLIEALIGVGMLGSLITGAMFISGHTSGSIQQRDRAIDAAIILQNISETLLFTSNAGDGTLAAGEHSKTYASNGQESADGYFKADWTITPNQPVNNVMRINITLSWTAVGLDRSSHLTLYRSMVLKTRTLGDERVYVGPPP